MSEQAGPFSAPAPQREVHTYRTAAQPGIRYVEIMRRVDIRRIDQVALIAIYDQNLSADVIGERVCEVFDHELATRASRQENTK